MIHFRYAIVKKPHIEVAVVDEKSKAIKASVGVNIEKPTMVHDFGVSEKYIVLPVHPLEFSPEVHDNRQLENKSMHKR